MKFFALAIIVTAINMQYSVAHVRGVVVSANLFGCPRDCGLFRATMHRGTPGTPGCRESCALFPLLAFFRECGGCGDQYSIEITVVGVPTEDDNTIVHAAERWVHVITKGLEDVSTAGLAPIASLCPYPEVVDDLFICIVYGDIDGPRGALGAASLDSSRTSNGLPIGGLFIVDRADIPRVKADGSFADVFAHEIGHLLGMYKRITEMTGLLPAYACCEMHSLRRCRATME
jgi:hypothetical protein